MGESGLALFGEVLYDCFPDGNQTLGGAPFNVAWHCQAFGLHPLFVSRVGDDVLGEKILTAMRDWGMRTDGIQVDKTYATGKVDVSFENGEPSYDIVENSAWDFIDFNKIPKVSAGTILYHGTLAARSAVSAQSLNLLKKSSPDSIFVDVNLRSPWWQLASVKALTHSSRWIKLNQEELSLLAPKMQNLENQARSLLSYSGAELIIVTQGEAGALVVTREAVFNIRPDLTGSIVDTVGAGDAFCSVLLLGLHNDWTIEESLTRAQQFASAIVGVRGATIQNRGFYHRFVEAWELNQ